MKYILFTAVLATIASTSEAQTETASKGTIVYEQTMQFRRNIVGLDPAIAERMPQNRTTQFELLYNSEATLFRRIEDMNNNDGGVNVAGGNFRILRMGGPGAGGGDLYRNLKTGLMLREEELADDTYLVVDTAQRRPGMMSNSVQGPNAPVYGKLRLERDSVKTIVGYQCQLAVLPVQMRTLSAAQREAMQQRLRESMNSGQGTTMRFGGSGAEPGDSTYSAEVQLWYTTQIPVQAGPVSYGNLPGMVLEVISENGRMHYKAVSVSPVVREKDLKEPGKGKRITPAEYQQKLLAFMEQMRQSGGGRRVQF